MQQFSNEDEHLCFTLFLTIICYKLPESTLSLKKKMKERNAPIQTYTQNYNLKAKIPKDRIFSKVIFQSLTSKKPLRTHRTSYSSVIT